MQIRGRRDEVARAWDQSAMVVMGLSAVKENCAAALVQRLRLSGVVKVAVRFGLRSDLD